MTKKLGPRIDESFEGANPDDIYKYLDWLRGSISDLVQTVRRTVAIIILLVAIFILIGESPKAVVSVAGFQVSKGSVVLQFIPVLAAFLFLQAMVDTGRLRVQRRAFSRVYGKWSPKVGSNDLDLLVQPALPLYWYIDVFVSEGYGPADLIDKVVAPISVLALPIALGVFEALAYGSLYHRPVDHPDQLRASVILTAIFYLTGLVYLVRSFGRWDPVQTDRRKA